MEDWASINEIISNFKQKKSVSKHFALNIVQDFLQEKFNPEERMDLDIKKGILEIKIKEPIVVQEIILRKEELRDNINELLRKVQKERKIDFSDFIIKEIRPKIR